MKITTTISTRASYRLPRPPPRTSDPPSNRPAQSVAIPCEAKSLSGQRAQRVFLGNADALQLASQICQHFVPIYAGAAFLLELVDVGRQEPGFGQRGQQHAPSLHDHVALREHARGAQFEQGLRALERTAEACLD